MFFIIFMYAGKLYSYVEKNYIDKSKEKSKCKKLDLKGVKA